jgi:transposase
VVEHGFLDLVGLPTMTPLRKTYRPWTPQVYQQETLSPRSQLPPDDLVFFLLDVIPLLDLTPFYAPYEDETRGAPPYDPAERVCLLLYAYAVGLFSSRKIALACERNLAFLAIVGADRPDFRTISDFRQRHLDAFAQTFQDVLRLAYEAGLVQLGVLATDGTKLAGNASRHKAMSYGHLVKQEAKLQAEIADLLEQARKQDQAEDAALGTRRGDELPEELRYREGRLAKLQAAKARLEATAKAEAEAERQRRAEAEAQREATGQTRRGREPGPIADTPEDRAQTNFTDPDLKIMKTNNKGWDYCGNAQVTVDDACQIILACDVVAACNDKPLAVPMAEATVANLKAAGLPAPSADAVAEGRRWPMTLDSGYDSAKAVAGLEALGFDPYVAIGRQRHASSGETPTPTPPQDPVKAAMAAKLATATGQAVYGLRKTTVEPVFGQIKGARGFRRFSLRGLPKVRGEWRLVCLTHNLLKVWRYGSASIRLKAV